MAFPTSSATATPASATTTKTAAPAYKPASSAAATTQTSPAAASGTSTKTTKAAKINLEQLLNRLKIRLAQNEAIRQAGEPKDLTMSAIARIAPDLHAGMVEVLEHFGFCFGEESNGLRFLPEAVREDGSTKPPALYFISLAAAPANNDGSAILRWCGETKEYASDDAIYPAGIRVIGKSAVLNTAAITCPIGLLVKSDLDEEQEKRLALANTFGELAEWLSESAGGNVLSDLPEGFLMFFTGAEARTSKKGNKYTLLHGTQLDAQSQPMGDVSIFSPGREADYWAGKESKVVLQYDSDAKLLNLLSVETGAAVDSLPLKAKTLKLKELQVGATYDWLGCELVQFKSSKGWVISVRRQAGENGEPGGNVEQCHTNRTIESTISGGAAMILEAAGLPTDDLDAIFKINVEQPFGTIAIRGHKPYSGGISVDVECLINKTASDKDAEDALFAELGLI